MNPEWIQGAVLDRNLCEPDDLDVTDIGDEDILVVISQSCDIRHDDERYIEVHVGRSIEAVDGNNTYRKNPRTLDVETNIAGRRRLLRFSQAERRQIPRERLCTTSPVAILPDDEIQLLARWTAARYTRPALPDAFNERRSASRNRISKIAKRSGADLSGIYIALNTYAELAEDELYEIFVLGTVPKEAADDPDRWEVARVAIKAIVEALHSPGIDILGSETRSEANVSLDEIKRFSKLDLEYMSERNGTTLTSQ